MIEFYKKYLKNNYKSKVGRLTKDLEKLLLIEWINIVENYSYCLSEDYNEWLLSKDWERVNQLYYTLIKNKENLSDTLLKFISKNQDNKNKRFKFVDTFAWCWGLSLWMENVWFNPVFINEIEPKFLESYYFNRDIKLDNYYCDDIRKLVDEFELYKTNFENIDLIVWWPPCQWFSMANRQRVIDDPRNELYRYYLKLLKLIHPKFFVMENVKWMMNKSDEVKNDFLNNLWNNYSISIMLLNAKDFGIPQNRERVFVIWSRLDNVSAKDITKDIVNEKENSLNFKLKDALDWLPVLWVKMHKNNSELENDIIWFKIKDYKYSITKYESYLNNRSVNYLFNHTNRYNNERDIEIFSRLPQWANSLHDSISDIMPYNKRNHIFKDKYYKLHELEVSKTITSHMKMDCNMYIHPTQSRWLSPRESARLQTFPDDYIFMWANNTWYAQIWNAVPVKLAELIWKHIIKHLK